MELDKVVDGIRTALSNKRVGQRWAGQFVSKMSPEDLKKAVETNFDPVAAIITEYSLGDASVRPLATLILKRYWRSISDELRSVPKIVARLGKNPANREALKDPRVVDWLNLTCQRAYEIFYLYAWGNNIDLKCAYCGATFVFDILNCVAMDFEGHGKKKLHIVLCPACGKQVQAVF